ncbi:MAG: flippase activity-associated protein Agl23 [Anaerolineae bacterium]
MPEENRELEMVTPAVSPDEGDGHLYPLSLLDRPAAGLFRLNLEQTIYVLLLLVAVATRFWGLGTRAMSHDESLHALFSWKLYAGEGYVHDPMMHGPFKFHVNALVYFLLGVSDFTTRIAPALFGVALVGLPYFFRRWLGRAGALTASVLFLISPAFLYYSRYIRDDIYTVVWTMLLGLALFRYVLDRQGKWLVFGAAVLSLAITTMENSFIVGFIGLTFIILVLVWERLSDQRRAWLQIGLLAVATLLALSVVALHLAIRANATGQPTLAVKLTPNLMFVAMLLVSALCATLVMPRGGQVFSQAVRALSWQNLRLPLIVFAVIYILLFTTFFTNPKGLFTGSIGAVAYWLAQQPVQRGSQPWYYYFFLMPFYELVPVFVGMPVLVCYIYKGIRRRFSGTPGDGLWLAYLVYWTMSSFVIYSWAGEKMPWLIVHPALPLLLLSAQAIGAWLEKQDWRAWLSRGGLVLTGVFLLMGAALLTLVRVQPFRGVSLAQLQASGRWLGAVAVLLLGAWLTDRYARHLGAGAIGNTLKITGLALLLAFTVRFAWMASYVNYDYASEFIVYAHGTPDLKVVVSQLEEISRRTAGDHELAFSYDQEDVWPLEWYFKDFPKRIFYGNEPTKTAMEAPVVLVNTDNEAKAKPFLGDRYYRFSYRLVWWPIEDYKGLTPAKIWQVLKDGERLDKWLTIWFYRRYPIDFSDWPYQNRFYMYIRKDVLNQMWDMGVTLALPSEMPADPYQQVWQELPANLVVGTTGSGNGQFNNPRGLAVGADGTIYVVDSGNARIQAFSANGEFLFSWGSSGTAPGQFTEPWGIAVAANGDVYVADTWNHRVQYFDAQGKFKGMWGFFVDVQGNDQAQPGGFWGPRDLVIDSDGYVYVTDTGNKRVQKFTADGQFVAIYGGKGEGPGQFDEPVGLARDAQGNFYVADTWNQRIQYFNAAFEYKGEWQVSSWQGQSLMNKPYLIADPEYVYATDPEGYRILVFDKQGNIKLTFGRYGDDASGMKLPIGLALDTGGRLWVSDSANNRLLRFERPRP